MASLFSYNTLDINLETKHHALEIYLNRPTHSNEINLEMLFELESILAWAAPHLEINTIFISSKTNTFSSGISQEDLIKFDEEKLQKLLNKLQKIVYTMFFLPQTIIVDLKSEAIGIGAELSLGADIRIANQNCTIAFNHLQKGLTPMSGGIGVLGSIIPKNTMRKWILSGLPIGHSELSHSGFIHDFYEAADSTLIKDNYFETISNQSPTARIQAKRSMLEFLLPLLDKTVKSEKKFSYASMSTFDWKNYVLAKQHKGQAEFTEARDFSSRLKSERGVTSPDN